MAKIRSLTVFAAALSLYLWLPSCVKRQPAALPPIMEVHLYSGVGEIGRLGDSMETIRKRNEKRRIQVSRLKPSNKLSTLGFSNLVDVPEVGARLYFKRNRVVLITLQAPFRGRIFGKKIKLFSFTLPKGTSWREAMIKEFGQPRTELAGGRLGSRCLFYRWGDVAYNKMGPNELAIHRDPKIARYRESNFGRQLELFQRN